MKKKKTKLNPEEIDEKFDHLYDEVSKKVNKLCRDILPKYLDACGCGNCGDEGDPIEYASAENAISKALCSLASRYLISARTLMNEPIDYATTAELKKNFEVCLEQNIESYNEYYREEVQEKRVLH